MTKTDMQKDGALGAVVTRSETADNIQQGSVEIISAEKALPKGHDIALELFGGHIEDFEYSAKEASWVRWKLDLILLPMMTITYILNYMDKVALSEASIFGIRKDLHLVGSEYSWSSSIFYLGYLFWQYPSSILMQKLPIGRYFGTMVILWGVVATTTVLTTSFTTLAVNRVFLGIFETCMSPILTILVGQYWTRTEHPLRASLWWTGSAIGAFIADAITYSLAERNLRGKYAVWQMVYLVFGPITIAWGFVLFVAIPTSPMTAWFLTEKERKIAVVRVVANQTGIQNREYKWHQVRECLRDPQVWMLVSFVFLQCLQAGGLTAFNKIVLTGLGYSERKATLMSMPCNTIHLVSVVIAGVVCSYFKNTRILMMVITNIIVLIGAILINRLPQTHEMSRLASFYILYVNTVSTILAMSLVSSNIAGFTKKATASVMVFIGYCVGQFCGPQFFKSSEAPHYTTAFNAIFATVTIMIALQITLAGYLVFQNRRRDRIAATVGNGHLESDANNALLDLTDWEMPSFRYVF